MVIMVDGVGGGEKQEKHNEKWVVPSTMAVFNGFVILSIVCIFAWKLKTNIYTRLDKKSKSKATGGKVSRKKKKNRQHAKQN